jgi:hypothetical protein
MNCFETFAIHRARFAVPYLNIVISGMVKAVMPTDWLTCCCMLQSDILILTQNLAICRHIISHIQSTLSGAQQSRNLVVLSGQNLSADLFSRTHAGGWAQVVCCVGPRVLLQRSEITPDNIADRLFPIGDV